MCITLMNHNIETYEKLVEYYKTKNIAAIVQATGTGKSYIALNYINDFHMHNNVLIVVPTRALLDYWRDRTTHIPNANIKIITYRNLLSLNPSEVNDLGKLNSLIIFDEMHRCGAEKWGNMVKSIIKEAAKCGNKILGMTATPIRTLDKNRDIVDEMFEGNQINGISLKDALINDVLPPFNYVAALYGVRNIVDDYRNIISRSKLKDLDKNYCSELTNKLLLDCESTSNINTIINKHLDLNKHQKIILFMENINIKKEINSSLIEWFPNAVIHDIDSTKSKKHCQQIITQFNDINEGVHILKVVDKLNEGVHIKGITSLIMLRKTSSNIIFLQQLGRGLDAANNKDGSQITIFDFVGNHINTSLKNNIVEMINHVNHERSLNDKKCVIVSDYTINMMSILNDIDLRLGVSIWSDDEINILSEYYPIEGKAVSKRLPEKTILQCQNKAKLLGIKYIFVPLWNDEELSILKEYYPIEGGRVSKRLPEKTSTQCASRANLLGLSSGVLWSKEETEILKEFYPLEGQGVYKRLPGRTKIQCIYRANLLGILRGNKTYWTEDEVKILKEFYPKEGSDVYKRIKGLSASQCVAKANRLKIKHEPWSKKELKILKEFYPLEGQGVYKRLPERTAEQCRSKATRLKLKSGLRDDYLVWTEEMDNIIREFYPSEGKHVYKRIPESTESKCTDRARRLDVKRVR